MGIIIDFIVALECSDGFRIGWKRVRHIRNGHPYDLGIPIESLKSELHPFTDKEYVYTINIRKCTDCGLTYNDEGIEFRGTYGE